MIARAIKYLGMLLFFLAVCFLALLAVGAGLAYDFEFMVRFMDPTKGENIRVYIWALAPGALLWLVGSLLKSGGPAR
ncbi:MAG: hypothetical protein GY807_02165 [Gammaproteobacteria bacterium]|nr:hypothetical protein [Gammaproteobacteria bacterium]